MFEGSPDREWRSDEPRKNRLVFIGRNLEADLLKEGFEDCLWAEDNATVPEEAEEVAAA
jgi:G3E family GTPase